jgi:putative FmdB family regulatory protein
MPTYVYKCDSCDHQFEIFQRMSDDPLDACPNCGEKVRRVIHPVGVVFKGSGWYINDSRSKNSTNTPTETSTSDTKSESTSTTTETPAAKTEPVKTAAD